MKNSFAVVVLAAFSYVCAGQELKVEHNGSDNNSSSTNAKNSSGLAIEKACQMYTLMSQSDLMLENNSTELWKFPWMVALAYSESNDDRINFYCGGVIISEKFILTAAHCAKHDRKPIFVRLGKAKLSDRNAENYFIKEIIKHPNYSSVTKKNDIALLHLKEPIVYRSNIRPACLETDLRDLDPSVPLTVTGWRTVTDSRFSPQSDELVEKQEVIMPLSECNTTYLEYNTDLNSAVLRSGISESQLCTQEPWRRDSCYGDSGGPLQIFRNSKTVHVIGIVSFGVSCGAEFPSVYTRVAFYADWIQSHVWPNFTKVSN